MAIREKLAQAAAQWGLCLRGGFAVSTDDSVPPVGPNLPARTLVMFGNVGSSMWLKFNASEEYHDGGDDALDRWSLRAGGDIAERFGGKALFPFGGPPHHPFISWAKKSEGLQHSRLGMLIHPDYGLWHAYRFALAFKETFTIPLKTRGSDICAECPDQPCLQHCPVGAFRSDGNAPQYDVERCYGHIKNSHAACMQSHCQARAACPVAVHHRYTPDHGRFHMRAFQKSLRRRFADQSSIGG